MAQDGQPPFRKPTKAEFEAAKKKADEQNYVRKPAAGAPEWALWQLHGVLVANAKLYESGDLDDQRDAVAGSLLAVHDYLVGRGFALAAIVPLMRPVAALVERENRSIDLLFAERKKGGRPKATLADHERTGILAALASFWLEWHKHDERKQIAKLRDAARTMKGPWFGEVTGANLKTARDLVMQEGGEHPAVTEAARFQAETILTVRAMYGNANAWSVLIQMLNDLSPMHVAITKIEKTTPVSPIDDD